MEKVLQSLHFLAFTSSLMENAYRTLMERNGLNVQVACKPGMKKPLPAGARKRQIISEKQDDRFSL